ncbi:MAG: hypothetical protein RBG13Loki_3300 [Promethearchaeota archaeon CR_4]|nr:MAG: hypothetical protein RBG13Loki_3300 [Candidatus Lokiarchaeota archaeon CR_4]
MGVAKILFLGGFLGGIFLFFLAWVSFTLLHLGDNITGGLLTNINSLFSLLGDLGGGIGSALGVLLPMLIGDLILMIFPLDWALTYRPDDIGLMFGIILPWAVAGVLVALIFAKNTKQGFFSGISLAIFPIILGIVAIIGLTVLGNNFGFDIMGIVDGVVVGLVDRTMIFAIVTATLEGGAIGGVFGALIGALKYKPGYIEPSKTKKTKSKDIYPSEEPRKQEDLFVDFQ